MEPFRGDLIVDSIVQNAQKLNTEYKLSLRDQLLFNTILSTSLRHIYKFDYDLHINRILQKYPMLKAIDNRDALITCYYSDKPVSFICQFAAVLANSARGTHVVISTDKAITDTTIQQVQGILNLLNVNYELNTNIFYLNDSTISINNWIIKPDIAFFDNILNVNLKLKQHDKQQNYICIV